METSPQIYEAGVETDPRDEQIKELERKLAEAEAEVARLRELAYRDPLTGLANRRQLQEDINHFFNGLDAASKFEKKRTAKETSVVIVADIDRFKQLNDTYGHKAGDEALRRAAEELEKRFKIRLSTGQDTMSVVSRTGGEEFVMFLSNCGATDAAKKLEEFVNPDTGDIEFTFDTGLTNEHGGAVIASFSFGLREFDHNQERDFDKILDEADQALYKAKETGRKRVVDFSKIKQDDEEK